MKVASGGQAGVDRGALALGRRDLLVIRIHLDVRPR